MDSQSIGSPLAAPEVAKVSSSSAAWLFGRRTDLLAFGGSAALALGLVAIAALFGVAEAAAPEWMWIVCIVCVDVAHVWSTLFRVYLDGSEIRRRPWLYLGLPVVLYLCGLIAHAFSSAAFWTALAYFAVYHFVRQQYGWVALYGRRARVGKLDRWIDRGAIYAATLYPILWWHAHLPRHFAWFLPGDFVQGLSPIVTRWLAPFYWGALGLFLLRQAQLVFLGRSAQAGKILVVLSTWACWWLGIVVLDGDFAFTATNVLIHGLPYMVLTYRYGRKRAEANPAGMLERILRFGVPGFVAVVLVFAVFEEALWDRWVWHDRPWLFGEGTELGTIALGLVVPLFALPQVTHYALDGFIWKARNNPELQNVFAVPDARGTSS